MATYLILNLIVIALLLPWIIRFRQRFTRASLISLLFLLAMTAIFDNLIVLAGIVAYDPALNLHVKVGTAPIEDFFYPLASVLLIPILWHNKDDHDR